MMPIQIVSEKSLIFQKIKYYLKGIMSLLSGSGNDSWPSILGMLLKLEVKRFGGLNLAYKISFAFFKAQSL